MPIIKHIPIYAVPKRLLSYVTNEKKTEKTLITGINCSEKADEVYEDMKLNFEMYSGCSLPRKTQKIDTQNAKIPLKLPIKGKTKGIFTVKQNVKDNAFYRFR